MPATMFPYDSQLVALVQVVPQTVRDVLQTMSAIDALCIDGDGLKWFNWLYWQVTQAVEARIAGGGFADAAFLAELDVQFARLFFDALRGFLTNGECPGCWAAMFEVRDDIRLTRIQSALAGINAHINHDLPEAIVITSRNRNVPPQHGTSQYTDYISLNGPIDGLVETAKRTLRVRLLGDVLPPMSHVEDTIAAWVTGSARGQAWDHAEALWLLQHVPRVAEGFLRGLDGLTTFGNKAMLVPVV